MSRFATTRAGRVLLHLMALFGDLEWSMHGAGIIRELKGETDHANK